jgi:hypothetical protein
METKSDAFKLDSNAKSNFHLKKTISLPSVFQRIFEVIMTPKVNCMIQTGIYLPMTLLAEPLRLRLTPSLS